MLVRTDRGEEYQHAVRGKGCPLRIAATSGVQHMERSTRRMEPNGAG